MQPLDNTYHLADAICRAGVSVAMLVPSKAPSTRESVIAAKPICVLPRLSFPGRKRAKAAGRSCKLDLGGCPWYAHREEALRVA